MMNSSDQNTKKKMIIRSLQHIDGESIPASLTVFGKHIEKNGTHYLFYDEYQDEVRYRCRITYDANAGILEQRKESGGSPGILRFQKGRTCECIYQTPMGSWKLLSETWKMGHEMKGDRMQIHLEYRLMAGDREMGEYELKIEL